MDEEGMQKTENDLIYVGHPIEMDDDEFLKELEELDRLSKAECSDMKHVVARIVPTYHPDYS